MSQLWYKKNEQVCLGFVWCAWYKSASQFLSIRFWFFSLWRISKVRKTFDLSIRIFQLNSTWKTKETKTKNCAHQNFYRILQKSVQPESVVISGWGLHWWSWVRLNIWISKTSSIVKLKNDLLLPFLKWCFKNVFTKKFTKKRYHTIWPACDNSIQYQTHPTTKIIWANCSTQSQTK